MQFRLNFRKILICINDFEKVKNKNGKVRHLVILKINVLRN